MILMNFIEFIDISAGSVESVDLSSFEPLEIGRSAEIIAAIASSGIAEASRGSGITLRGEMHRSKAMLILFDGETQISNIAICICSEHSPELWDMLNASIGQPKEWHAPTSPWAAVTYSNELMLPPWHDRVIQSIAASMFVHKTGPKLF
jgi:hypothetical protein